MMGWMDPGFILPVSSATLEQSGVQDPLRGTSAPKSWKNNPYHRKRFLQRQSIVVRRCGSRITSIWV